MEDYRKASIKILIKTEEGKLQEFTLDGLVKNPDILLGSILWSIENAINEHTKYRAHASIEGERIS